MLVLGVILTPACVTAGWSNEDALNAEWVEIQLDENARPLAVEFHVSPDEVPANIMDAMDALYPGGSAVAAEKEFVGSNFYWEVTKEIDGREVEAMFQQNGKLHSLEIEVPADSVPESVRAAVQTRIQGQINKWEEIRDENRILVEYHAKLTANGKKYKAMVSTDGNVLGLVREVPAEIEVPVP
jgi:hypothetical protein